MLLGVNQPISCEGKKKRRNKGKIKERGKQPIAAVVVSQLSWEDKGCVAGLPRATLVHLLLRGEVAAPPGAPCSSVLRLRLTAGRCQPRSENLHSCWGPLSPGADAMHCTSPLMLAQTWEGSALPTSGSFNVGRRAASVRQLYPGVALGTGEGRGCGVGLSGTLQPWNPGFRGREASRWEGPGNKGPEMPP